MLTRQVPDSWVAKGIVTVWNRPTKDQQRRWPGANASSRGNQRPLWSGNNEAQDVACTVEFLPVGAGDDVARQVGQDFGQSGLFSDKIVADWNAKIRIAAGSLRNDTKRRRIYFRRPANASDRTGGARRLSSQSE